MCIVKYEWENNCFCLKHMKCKKKKKKQTNLDYFQKVKKQLKLSNQIVQGNRQTDACEVEANTKNLIFPQRNLWQNLYNFCFLTEKAMFLWKKKFCYISVKVLRIVLNVEKFDFSLASGCMCRCVCVCACVSDFQRFKPQ